MVVAIDGPSGVGKSTVARAVASALNLAYLDTGATYRAATLIVLRSNIDVTDEPSMLEELAHHHIDYDETGITVDGATVSDAVRTEAVTAKVSAVSAHPRVRDRIVAIQRQWVDRRGGDAVVEGRDIGTVVFPQAPIKIYLTARAEVRAARRAGDAEAEGVSVNEIASALAARDEADSTRKASPLRPARDATTIDTSDVDIEGVVAAIIELVNASTSKDSSRSDS